MVSQLKREVKRWANSGGIRVPKEYIGQEVYVITKEDLQVINALGGGSMNG